MSEVKVNKISPRTACGTVTLGDSGDTFTIPSGATITNAGTASGFGATGETSWDTTVKTTGTFTATAGVGYFLDTTGGIITVNLPVGAAGSSVAMADYAATWQTNNVTVAANGSEKIGGDTNDATLNTKGQSVTFVYVDSTQGWVNVIDSTSNVRGQNPYVVATGGTPCAGATCGDYKIHTFTGPGTLCVSSAGTACGSNGVDYLVVAGGAGGGSNRGGGGGAGGLRASATTFCNSGPSSPRTSGVVIAPVTVQGYAIVVGGAGSPGAASNPGTPGGSGGVSSFSTIPSAGGGGGGGSSHPTGAVTGGSGGGAQGCCAPGAAGNTPPTSPAQGMPGGPATPAVGAGGGGGALVAGVIGIPSNKGGAGGAGGGFPTAFGTSGQNCGGVYYFSGGGGGGGRDNPDGTAGVGGLGGGGTGGAAGPVGTGIPGYDATINTGGAGGGGGNNGSPCKGGSGGSGIVIIRYKFQN